MDHASRAVLLRTNVITLHTLSVRQTFVGHERMRTSQEAVSRDNLTQLVERLAAALAP